MSRHDMFEGILASLYDAMLDDAYWPATVALIDEACGATGNELVIAEGSGADARVAFAKLYYRGQHHEELERDYVDNYYALDERVPRIRRSPDSRLVHVTSFYTEQELKTSPAYNEILLRSGAQKSLNVRMDGPDGSRIVWVVMDPTESDGWGSDQIGMVGSLLPHIRQFVRVRQALAKVEALGASLIGLLDNARVGVIHLDRRGRVVAANSRACAILRQADGLSDRGGFLGACSSGDNDRLQKLLARALPAVGGEAVSGSMAVRRSPVRGRFTLHVSPVGVRQMDLGAQRVAVLVLVVDPARQPRIDPALVGAALGLTSAESQVATALAQGSTVRDIVAATRRKETTVRWLIRQIYVKQGINRQSDLVRLVLSAAEFAGPRP